MEWTAEGLIIGARKHGENSVIIETVVAGHGRYMGLVRGGRSRKQAAALQPGNTVQLTWRARLEDHLGNFTVEVLKPRAAVLIEDRVRLYAAQLIFDHLRLLPERDPVDRLLGLSLDLIDEDVAPLRRAADLASFELVLLDELGFGLDLYSCAVSGETEGLTHVSPRTGRAVTAKIAQPYEDKLLVLPEFLLHEATASEADVMNAFRLTGHFLHMHVWAVRNISPPTTRDTLITQLCRAQ